MRTYVRTDGRGRPPNFLGLLDFPFSMGMELRPRAPKAPVGAPLKNTSKMQLTKNKVRLKYIKNLIIIYRMIYHWIENKKKKINESWFCDICNDGLDYGIRGKVNHILSKSEKYDKIMKDFVYEKMGRPKITLEKLMILLIFLNR